MRFTKNALGSENAQSFATKTVAFISDHLARSKAAFLARSGCDLLSSADDFKAECALQSLENPELDASKIIAIVVNRALQSRSQSAIATVFLDRDLREGEKEVQIEAPKVEEIEEWRVAPEDQIEGLRQKIIDSLLVTDRRARQILNRLAGQVDQAGKNDLFGRELLAAAALEGRVTRRARCKKTTGTRAITDTQSLFNTEGGGA